MMSSNESNISGKGSRQQSNFEKIFSFCFILFFADLLELPDNQTLHQWAVLYCRLLQQFCFEQQKTQVGALVNFACGVFNRNPGRRGMTDIAQLLVIVSDGRGVMNDGEEVVRQAVRRAKHMGIFMVFVIIDNPHSKVSSFQLPILFILCSEWNF